MEAPLRAELHDEAQLERRIRSLGLRMEESPAKRLVGQLHTELASRGLAFPPPAMPATTWFVPVGIPAIFVPFFPLPERLRRLDRRMIREVEEAPPEGFMRLIRHQAAHAYASAYGLP